MRSEPMQAQATQCRLDPVFYDAILRWRVPELLARAARSHQAGGDPNGARRLCEWADELMRLVPITTEAEARAVAAPWHPVAPDACLVRTVVWFSIRDYAFARLDASDRALAASGDWALVDAMALLGDVRSNVEAQWVAQAEHFAQCDIAEQETALPSFAPRAPRFLA